MSAEIFSVDTFKWIMTILTGLGASWALVDIIYIIRLVRSGADSNDPLVKDKYFGYAIGIAIGLLGFAGILRYHDVL
ncbi:MAG TPA: hypothetical protein VIU61_13380 [Kofleriaceae bacterium]